MTAGDDRKDASMQNRVPATIELHELSKSFGAIRAVDRVSATAMPGQVTALLGPNGAGKTTILRVLLGLATASSGAATFSGERYDELTEPVRRVGAVLETSGWHPGRNARDQLRILATASRLPVESVEWALAETGLSDAGGRRVGGFSLGMRQRLGLGAAMLGDPDVLVLDEPTNGLDPPGMRWLRAHLRKLADEGRTVLVSSHALPEVEQIADHVLLLSHGRLIRSATLNELRAEVGAGSRIRTPEADRVVDVMRTEGIQCTPVDEDLVIDASPEQVGGIAARNGLVLHRLMPTIDLEHVFFQLVGDSEDESSGPVERAPR